MIQIFSKLHQPEFRQPVQAHTEKTQFSLSLFLNQYRIAKNVRRYTALHAVSRQFFGSVMDRMTSSRLKLAGFARGGNSLKD